MDEKELLSHAIEFGFGKVLFPLSCDSEFQYRIVKIYDIISRDAHRYLIFDSMSRVWHSKQEKFLVVRHKDGDFKRCTEFELDDAIKIVEMLLKDDADDEAKYKLKKKEAEEYRKTEYKRTLDKGTD